MGDEQHIVIDDVLADSKGKDTVEAREKALIESQQLAFIKLLKQISSEKIQSDIPSSEILPLIYDFSVKEEKLSPNRYQAILKYRFNKKAVNKWLEAHSLHEEKETEEKPIKKLHKTKEFTVFAKAIIEIPNLFEWFKIEKKLINKTEYKINALSNNRVEIEIKNPELLSEINILENTGEGTWRYKTRQ